MNPLYNMFFPQNSGQTGGSAPANGFPVMPNQQALMGQLQANPVEMLRSAGYHVPDELNGNPQAMVQHLMQTGQVGGPIMQRIQPMLRMMSGR